MPVLECPTCHRQVEYEALAQVPHRPFCSRRCKLVDLGKWLNEEYRVSEELSEPGAGEDPAGPKADQGGGG